MLSTSAKNAATVDGLTLRHACSLRADLSGVAGRPDGVIYRQQYVRCGKVGCRRCPPNGLGHGPYRYGYYWDYRQRTRSFYVGKTLPVGVKLITASEDAAFTRPQGGDAHT